MTLLCLVCWAWCPVALGYPHGSWGFVSVARPPWLGGWLRLPFLGYWPLCLACLSLLHPVLILFFSSFCEVIDCTGLTAPLPSLSWCLLPLLSPTLFMFSLLPGKIPGFMEEVGLQLNLVQSRVLKRLICEGHAHCSEGRLHGSFTIAQHQGIKSKLVAIRKEETDASDVTKKELSRLTGQRRKGGSFEFLEMLNVKIKRFALKVEVTIWGKTWETFEGLSATRMTKCPDVPRTEKVPWTWEFWFQNQDGPWQAREFVTLPPTNANII